MSWSTFNALDPDKYPFLSSSYGFKWLDEKERVIICPMHERWGEIRADRLAIDEKIWQLQRLGCKVCGEIQMPLDLQTRFFYTKYPSWLEAKEDDEDPCIISLTDSKGRHRGRVITTPVMQGTSVFTRYWPTDYHESLGKLLPCVIDIEESEEDDEKVIWVDEHYDKVEGAGVGSIWDNRDLACKWLDANYPNWKDPMAYWTENSNAPDLSDSGHAT